MIHSSALQCSSGSSILRHLSRESGLDGRPRFPVGPSTLFFFCVRRLLFWMTILRIGFVYSSPLYVGQAFLNYANMSQCWWRITKMLLCITFAINTLTYHNLLDVSLDMSNLIEDRSTRKSSYSFLSLSRSANRELAAISLNSEQKCIITKLLTLTSQPKCIPTATIPSMRKRIIAGSLFQVSYFSGHCLIASAAALFKSKPGRDALNMSYFCKPGNIPIPFSILWVLSFSLRRF